MDITSFCTQSSVLVVAGKGGVGKSTVSATLARLAARSGLSVPLVGRSGGDDKTASQHDHEATQYGPSTAAISGFSRIPRMRS
jgi:anion-transporting  ArsA/GET3 family ATPase